jgi:hypothetical protein
MEKILIEHTKTTPKVILDHELGTASIEGESYPENAIEFFKPVFAWLSKYKESNQGLTFIFKLNYFNTSSSKCIMDIFESLEEYHLKGADVKVKWMYHVDDEDMMESGQEFVDDLELTLELESYESENESP